MQMASRNSAFKQCKNHSLLGVREKPPVLLVDIYFKNFIYKHNMCKTMLIKNS